MEGLVKFGLLYAANQHDYTLVFLILGIFAAVGIFKYLAYRGGW